MASRFWPQCSAGPPGTGGGQFVGSVQPDSNALVERSRPSVRYCRKKNVLCSSSTGTVNCTVPPGTPLIDGEMIENHGATNVLTRTYARPSSSVRIEA